LYGKEPVQQRRLLTVQNITAAIDYKTEHTQPNRLSVKNELCCYCKYRILQVTVMVADSYGIYRILVGSECIKKLNRHELSNHFTEFSATLLFLKKEQKCGKEEVSNDLLHNESEILTHIFKKKVIF
jgi:hypothetical protein